MNTWVFWGFCLISKGVKSDRTFVTISRISSRRPKLHFDAISFYCDFVLICVFEIRLDCLVKILRLFSSLFKHYQILKVALTFKNVCMRATKLFSNQLSKYKCNCFWLIGNFMMGASQAKDLLFNFCSPNLYWARFSQNKVANWPPILNTFHENIVEISNIFFFGGNSVNN